MKCPAPSGTPGVEYPGRVDFLQHGHRYPRSPGARGLSRRLRLGRVHGILRRRVEPSARASRRASVVTAATRPGRSAALAHSGVDGRSRCEPGTDGESTTQRHRPVDFSVRNAVDTVAPLESGVVVRRWMAILSMVAFIGGCGGAADPVEKASSTILSITPTTVDHVDNDDNNNDDNDHHARLNNDAATRCYPADDGRLSGRDLSMECRPGPDPGRVVTARGRTRRVCRPLGGCSR